MVSSFDKNVSKLKKEIFINYLTKICDNFSNLELAAKNNNFIALKEIIEEDKNIDFFHTKNYDDCVWLIARENPLGTDLRNTIALLFMNRELERIANAAKKVAILIIEHKDVISASEYYNHLDLITRSVINQLKSLQKLLKTTNMDSILSMANRDVVIDKLYNTKVSEIAHIIQSTKLEPEVQAYSSIVIALKSLERAGDKIVDILEEYVYYRKGLHYGLK